MRLIYQSLKVENLDHADRLVIFRVDGIRYKMPRAEIAALSELQGQHLVDLGIKATECFVDLGLKAPEKHSVEEILNEYSCWKTQKSYTKWKWAPYQKKLVDHVICHNINPTGHEQERKHFKLEGLYATYTDEYADLLTLIEKNFIHSYELNQLKRLESVRKQNLRYPDFSQPIRWPWGTHLLRMKRK